MIRVGLLGAHGRMGQWVAKLLQSEYLKVAKIEAIIGRNDRPEALLNADVVIDFSSPGAMQSLAVLALKHEGPLPAFVIGSTGWKPEERKLLEELSKKTPVLISSNFSTGVLAICDILRYAAPLLEKLGYTPVIVETHHQHKKDAPSGTALSLQRAISAENPNNVQTLSVRGGEIIGDHEVTFYGPGDHITLGHFAQDRSIFARGAIDVALWLSQRKTGVRALKGIVPIEKYFEELKA